MTDGQISHIRPEARNSSRPWGEAVLFIRGWENKPNLQAPFHLSLLLSLCLSACATSLQHHTVVCNSLNCHYPSPTQRGLKEPVLKATHTLKRGRISLCEKKNVWKSGCVCVCLSYLMSSVEEGWDASLCCRSLDPYNTRELSLNVRSTCPFMYTNKMSELCMSM